MKEDLPLDAKVALCIQYWDELVTTHSIDDLASGIVKPAARTVRTKALLSRLDKFAGAMTEKLRELSHKTTSPFLSLGPSHADFLRNVLLPNAEKIRRAHYLSDEDGEELLFLLADLDTQPRTRRKYENAFLALIDFCDNHFSDEDGFRYNIETALEAYYRPWFTPDEWDENIEALRPAIVGIDDSKIPLRVQVRLSEVRRTFMAGAWMATIAMARSLLEFALSDSAGRIGYNASALRPDGTVAYLKLDELISEASRCMPSLEPELRLLQDAGNRILHPRKRQNVVATPKVLKSEALACAQAATRAVEVLYTPK